MSAATKTEVSFARLDVGDPAPWFKQAATNNPTYSFSMAAGRYVVLCFFVTGADPVSQAALAAVEEHQALFDDDKLCLFGVSMDPQDQTTGRVQGHSRGIRHFWDFDATICQAFGVVPIGARTPPKRANRFWVVLDPTLRVMAKFPLSPDAGDISAVFDYLKALPPVDLFAGFEVPAPILVLPNVFEPELCQMLIAAYEADGGTESGFMREINGKTVQVDDHRHKRRRDFSVTDPRLVATLQNRINRRVAPELKKVYSFTATRMERYIVGCYCAEDKAHFNAHRDNTTKGTAHRRFAVSINLNADFRGGEVSFPEYGSRSYKAPPGGAVIFPCALLHAVSEVTEGRRYAFLPFLYDEAAARIREENAAHVEGEQYRASPVANAG